jgi:hypothetical protein
MELGFSAGLLSASYSPSGGGFDGCDCLHDSLPSPFAYLCRSLFPWLPRAVKVGNDRAGHLADILSPVGKKKAIYVIVQSWSNVDLKTKKSWSNVDLQKKSWSNVSKFIITTNGILVTPSIQKKTAEDTSII